MRANELMLGDWVESRGKIEQVREVYEGYICTDSFEDSHDYYFDPIPLTTEILEKNGFVKSERYEVWKIIQDDYEMRITPWRFAVIFLEDGADKEEFSIPRPNFVHELQHAMRLCGIEKEIVLS